MVTADMEFLTGIKETDELEGHLGVLFEGHLWLKQEEKAQEILKAVLDRFPETEQTANLVGKYLVSVGEIDGQGDVKQWTKEMVRNRPGSVLARKQLRQMIMDGELSNDAIDSICDKWREAEPNDPQVLFRIAAAYFRAEQLDKAAVVIDEALNMILKGNSDDPGNFMADSHLQWTYKLCARIALARKDYATALASATALQMLPKETKSTGYDYEGMIWLEVGRLDKATEAFVYALEKGSKQAPEKLAETYRALTGGDDGFDKWLVAAQMKYELAGDRPQAKAFSAIDLEGNKLSLDELKGKVVVLNFWFKDCGPCKREMPGLNQMVQDYAGKDVVFIAPALDNAEKLTKFLKKSEFNYQVVAEANDLAETYEVTSFPTHVIIDRDGRVEARITGGTLDRHDDIRPFIEKALTR